MYDQGITAIRQITSGISSIKEVDLMEIFREIIILNSLIKYNFENKNLVSADYLAYAKENELISSSQFVENCMGDPPCDDKMVYTIFGEPLSYETLPKYSPADTEVEI